VRSFARWPIGVEVVVGDINTRIATAEGTAAIEADTITSKEATVAMADMADNATASPSSRNKRPDLNLMGM